ncbi:MAG TPA: hypothetical protein VFX95_00190, partial [Caulobacteraceae bacterium]|nr:hypothetical protein [Caulobacteraceae bacterium]
MPAVAARQLYWIVYGAAALALAWVIVTGAVSAHYAEDDPARALKWRPADPVALRTLAEQALEQGKPDLARRHALAVLARSPHDATAYRLLGEAARKASNEATARRMFARAGRLTRRDATLAAIFFEEAVAARRWREATTQADVLIRRSPRSESAVLFRLAVLARDPQFAAVLAQALTTEPAWRGAFFRELSSTSAHIAAATLTVGELRAAGGAVKQAELSPLLSRMVGEGQAAQARRLWAGGLPGASPAADAVYDPAFRAPDAGPPFGWSVGEHIRSQVGFGSGSGAHIELSGIEPEQLLRQTLVLPPGRYELESAGRWQAGRPLSLAWLIGCAGAPPVRLELT